MPPSAIADRLKPPIPAECRAWMGYRSAPSGEIMVRVCAWCPDAMRARECAKPLKVTDGICVPCYQKMIAQELGEAVD